MKTITALLVCILSVILIAGCGKTNEDPEPTPEKSALPEDYKSKVMHSRAEKDRFFANNSQSPIEENLRDEFEGLNYYPVSEKYYVEAKINRIDDPDTVMIRTTKEDDIRKMLKFAALKFELNGRKLELAGYMPIMTKKYLFVPFTDETTGKETYEVGRYIDIECSPEDDSVIIDFNRAYNPFCAYNPRYSCPLVPQENHLPVRLEAGEKIINLKNHKN